MAGRPSVPWLRGGFLLGKWSRFTLRGDALERFRYVDGPEYQF